MGDSEQECAARVAKINDLLQPVAGDFETVHAHLLELQKAVHEHIASVITEPINRKLASMPHTTKPEKQALGRWCNAVARSLNIAIRDPKTSQPAMLFAGHGGRRPLEGSFQIELIDPHNRRRVATSYALPRLEFMPHYDKQREHMARYWAEKAPRPTPSDRGRE
ncbi:MAG: hypothetical protein AB7G17_01045 [Phycisphaerales bacterium]